ncbi:GNAT family N-acetyltransferase [Paenibacillus sp. J2TS4]|uniref:GNAT family N-acetyltransferase n=1 Tax=Paenibacillus sp. J2TS4 TaxID=2807194 RepID=UPI001B0A5F05|nr:GNAT family N-acetyltransferase [Paenibacillus sp. J2TS4]GIP31549.1 acetyltransferase [Paenibacillus sp. J2TS4]
MEIRCLLTQKELDEAAKLSDSIFRDSEQGSMQTAFSHVFSEPLGQSYGAFDDGKLVSFMGLVPVVLRIGEAKLPAYSLGSVCTHPDYRGRGTASEILALIFDHMNKAGAPLLLVSGGRSLYTRAGCHTFGQVHHYQWEEGQPFPSSSLPEGAIVRELAPTDWFRLHKLARGRFSRYEQSLWDLAGLIHANALSSCFKLTHKVVVAQKADGDLLAFAVVGIPYLDNPKRGPHLFEWGGAADAIPALLNYAAQAYGMKQLTIPVPWHEEQLVAALEGLPRKTGKANGTICITDPERLLDELRPYLMSVDAKTAAALQIKRLENGGTHVSLDGSAATLSVQETISLFFDPDPEIDAPEPLKGRLASLFPIPFPYDAGLNYV